MCATIRNKVLLQRISNFTTEEVVALLLKNKLAECCDAVLKRQISGEQFLHLREDNLILWKRDLPIALRRSLSQFIEDVNNYPEQYLYFDDSADTLSSSSHSVNSEGLSSDHSDEWDTEFEEDETYDPSLVNRRKKSAVSYSQDNSSNNCVGSDQESDEMEKIYTNNNVSAEIYRYEGTVDSERYNENSEENIYQNNADRIESVGPTANVPRIPNVIKSNNPQESTLVAQLLEGLKQKGLCQKSPVGPKPPTGPKPTLTSLKRPSICNRKEVLLPVADRSKARPVPVSKSPNSTTIVTETSKPAKSINRPKVTQTLSPNFIQSLGTIKSKPPSFRQPTPLTQKQIPTILPPLVDNSYRKSPTNLPKPPAAPMENFRSLPDDGNDSDDDTYEPVDSQSRGASMADRLNLRLQRLNSSYSIENGNFKGSAESVYRARSESSYEESYDNESEYEIINEAKDQVDDEYLKPLTHQSSTNSPGLVSWQPYTPPLRFPERSPNPKSATLPHSRTQGTSGSHGKVIRPLPPPPNPQRLDRAHQQQPISTRNDSIDDKSYKNKPWYRNISREEAIALIEGAGSSRLSPPDGYFLVRPSSANSDNPLVLVVFYQIRAYNIPVRKRSDNRYSLGTARSDEFAFASVEEMINFHSMEEISIQSKGVSVGNCRLTITPLRTNES